MSFVQKTTEENNICVNSAIGKRDNSPKIDYMNKVNDKPWGKEYLAYQNEHIGIWILHINKDQETSLHCHFKKDTILIPIFNSFKINLYSTYKILNLFEALYVPLNTFHGIHSYTDGSILMEIEIYTDKISYTDKNDLLRLRDIYGRDKTKYETSVEEREPTDNEIMNFHSPNKYSIGNTQVSILKLRSLDELYSSANGINHYDKIILLKGTIFYGGKILGTGSSIDIQTCGSWMTGYSCLAEYIELLCLSNIDYGYSNKIIYSKDHLVDHLEMCLMKTNIPNIQPTFGLTSGCFDILHEGHIKNLKTSKQMCDKLFVCLSSDTQIKRLKGETRPINNIADRLNMLINFDFIDYIILYDETDDKLEMELDNIMNIIKPDTWFKGCDYNREDILKKHPSLKNICLIDIVEGKSTTNIIKKITT